MRVLKRLFDLVTASALLVAGLPLLVAAAAWIRLVSGPGVVFRQERIGRDEQPFSILKLRTMSSSPAPGSSTTLANDPRLIRGGRLLRAMKVDELPQLVNVVRGDMSLVGPRPTVQADVDRMTSEQRRRHTATPGITGLAQISGSTSLDWPERIELDLEYIDRWSLASDARILVRTFRLVLSGRADTHPSSDDEWGTSSSGVTS